MSVRNVNIRRLFVWLAVLVLAALAGSVAYLWWVSPRGEMQGLAFRPSSVAPTPEFDAARGQIKSLVERVSGPPERDAALGDYLESLYFPDEERPAVTFPLSDAEQADLAALVAAFQDRELPPAPDGHWFNFNDIASFLSLTSVYLHAADVSPEEACRGLIAALNVSAGYERDPALKMGVGLATMPMELALRRGGKLLKAPPELLKKLRDGLWARAAPGAAPSGFGVGVYLLAEGHRRENATSWRAVLPDGCLERYAAKADAEARANNLLGLNNWLGEQPRLLSPCGNFVDHLWLATNAVLDGRAKIGMICCALTGVLTPGGLSAYLEAASVDGPDYRQDPYASDGTRFRLETTDTGQRLVSIGPGYYPKFSEEGWELTLEIGKSD